MAEIPPQAQAHAHAWLRRLADGIRALPQELLTEMLVRLPAEDICQWMVASKRFYNLVTSSYFTQMWIDYHYPHFQQQIILLSEGNFFSLNLADFDHEELPTELEPTGLVEIDPPVVDGFEEQIFLLGSARGLLLLGVGYEFDFWIWNPLLRRVGHVLAPPEVVWEGDGLRLGFGFVNDKFHLVILSLSREVEGGTLKLDAYVLVLGDPQEQWVLLECPVKLPSGALLSGTSNDLVNDAVVVWSVYWPAYHDNVHSIWAFDLQTRTFICDGVLGGRLYTYRRVDDSQVEVWRLENFGEWELWTRVTSFDMDADFPGLEEEDDNAGNVNVIADEFQGVVAATAIRHRLLVYTSEDHLIGYDPVNSRYFFFGDYGEHIPIIDNSPDLPELEVVSYQESLIWPYTR
ncbi:hypothetical protein Cgig2_025783 [Carnegiea gigantea]|uniref:F-box domain-containing protein n=1 Tax=Carnegiea gigantea TaxID=171969 RepID=A0A9Q1GKB0_9CARY|nr:hypothetical protein Cgig2_025783 [Carnegiea gigantea]